MSPYPSAPAWPSPGRQAAVAGLLWAGQVVAVTGCIAIMAIALKTNGRVFTAGLEHTRFEVWVFFSGLAALTVCTVFGCLFGMRALGGARTGFLLVQVVVVLAVLATVIWFAFAIPAPPGIHSAPLFTGY